MEEQHSKSVSQQEEPLVHYTQQLLVAPTQVAIAREGALESAVGAPRPLYLWLLWLVKTEVGCWQQEKESGEEGKEGHSAHTCQCVQKELDDTVVVVDLHDAENQEDGPTISSKQNTRHMITSWAAFSAFLFFDMIQKSPINGNN